MTHRGAFQPLLFCDSVKRIMRLGMHFEALTEAKACKRPLEHSKNESPLRKKIGLCIRYLAILSMLTG